MVNQKCSLSSVLLQAAPASPPFRCLRDRTEGRMPQVHPRVSCPREVSDSTAPHDKFCEMHTPPPSFSPATFTVWKRSLIFNANGFTVFNSSGDLVFRVDNYSAKHELFLMDAVGKILLTIRHKRLSVKDRWEAFRGDCCGYGIKPAFSVVKSVSILFSSKPSAKVVLNPAKKQKTKLCDYEIEGSFCKPSSLFTVFGASRQIIAQAARKQATSGIMLGDDVLNLVVQPGVDQTFVMGLLIIFCQINKQSVIINRGADHAVTTGSNLGSPSSPKGSCVDDNAVGLCLCMTEPREFFGELELSWGG